VGEPILKKKNMKQERRTNKIRITINAMPSLAEVRMKLVSEVSKALSSGKVLTDSIFNECLYESVPWDTDELLSVAISHPYLMLKRPKLQNGSGFRDSAKRILMVSLEEMLRDDKTAVTEEALIQTHKQSCAP
jgi:AAA+ superfamily predicted ATPase